MTRVLLLGLLVCAACTDPVAPEGCPIVWQDVENTGGPGSLQVGIAYCPPESL